MNKQKITFYLEKLLRNLLQKIAVLIAWREEKITNIRTNRRRPIFNPMIQLVVVNLYTKFEVSILNSCADILDEKSGKKETKKRTNTRMNK